MIPTLLLPGLLCDATLWRAQIDALADLCAPAIADLTLDDSIAAMAGRALAAAPPRFALAALSMGGYVAFEILRRAPERVTKLALLATSASPDDAARTAQRQDEVASLGLGRFLGVTDRLLPQLIHADLVAGPVGAAVQAMAQRVGSAAFIRQQTAIAGRPDSRPLLATIHIPTLVLVGDSDRLTPPSEAQIIHEGILDSRLFVLETCGHLPPLERPDETAHLLREWLTG